MLEQKDLDSIKQIMEDTLKKTENTLFEEIGRTQTYLEDKVEIVQKNIEELNQYYRITKLENDNTTLLLKMMGELSKRIEDLEKKSA